jgi:cystathionine beta-synthase
LASSFWLGNIGAHPSDEWIGAHGFSEDASAGQMVGSVLAQKADTEEGIPNFVHMHPTETVGEAVSVLREYGVSQMPVVAPGAGHPDVMAGEVIGAVEERELLQIPGARASP